MKWSVQRVAIGLTTTVLALSSIPSGSPAFARDRVHGQLQRPKQIHRANPAPSARSAEAPRENSGAAALPRRRDARGLYAGAGGIFSPDYEVPGREVYHFGGQLLGGEFGKAYEDYYRHYYYYKYAYCPLGSSYVIYLQRCVGPLDYFR